MLKTTLSSVRRGIKLKQSQSGLTYTFTYFENIFRNFQCNFHLTVKIGVDIQSVKTTKLSDYDEIDYDKGGSGANKFENTGGYSYSVSMKELVKRAAKIESLEYFWV